MRNRSGYARRTGHGCGNWPRITGSCGPPPGGDEANRLLAPLLQLPGLPVIRFPPVPFHPRDKLPPIIRFAGRRPLAWIDDALAPEAHAWAAERGIPTLLISVDPAKGLTRRAVDRALRWAASLTG